MFPRSAPVALTSALLALLVGVVPLVAHAVCAPVCVLTLSPSGCIKWSTVCTADSNDGACGTAVHTATENAPQQNVCAIGTADTPLLNFVSSGAWWTWHCAGVNGGTTASCSAPYRVLDPNKGISAPLPNVVKGVSASGDSASLSVSVQLNFDATTLGKQGSVFVGAYVPPFANGTGLPGIAAPSAAASERVAPTDGAAGSWYVFNGSNWSPMSTSLPATFSGTLSDANSVIHVLNNANGAALCGTQLYVGYGSSAAAMLANNTLGKFYTVACNYSFGGARSGTTQRETLGVSLQVATIDIGRSGSVYVGGLFGGQVYFFDGRGWSAFTGGTLPSCYSGPLGQMQIPLFADLDVTPIVGAQVFVGYGSDQSDMLNNRRFGLVSVVQ